MPLVTASNLADPDAAYRMIVEANRGLSEAQSAALQAAALLLLANHVGDARVLQEALALARETALEAAKP
ncbi:MAG: DUF2783 domain-containing protein [Hyphomicrobiaceae bacterium]|nr:DUF2783 domain-containing protein [Hyphomicrobiaceae bacterium]